MAEDFGTNITLFGPVNEVRKLVVKIQEFVKRRVNITDAEYSRQKIGDRYLITNADELAFVKLDENEAVESVQDLGKDQDIDLVDDFVLLEGGNIAFAQLTEIRTRREQLENLAFTEVLGAFSNVFVETNTFGDCSGQRDALTKGYKILAYREIELEQCCRAKGGKMSLLSLYSSTRSLGLGHNW